MPEFKDMLKYLRMREGLSQSELAEKLGVSASRISMYEVGKREPDFETEEKIADFFNTDLNTLRGRDIEAPPPRCDYSLEILSIAKEISENKELRLLLEASRNVSNEHLRAYRNLINSMQNLEKEDNE